MWEDEIGKEQIPQSHNTKHVYIDGYKHISTVVSETQKKLTDIRDGKLKPYLTRSKKETERIGGYFGGNQLVIGGRLGTGKSAKVLQDMADFTNPIYNPYAEDTMILFDSYEMPDWSSMLRLGSQDANIEVKTFLDYQKNLSEERWQTLMNVFTKFKHLPIYITTRPRNVETWKEEKKQIQGKNPKKRIINIFDHARLIRKKDEGSEEERLTNLMIAGIDLKNNFDMFNIFLSQMNRNIETNMNRDRVGTSLPMMSDLFGGDSIGQCADIVMILFRPGMYRLTEFEGIPTGYDPNNPHKVDDLLLECILKQRDGWTGVLTMKHDMSKNKIEDYDTNIFSNVTSTSKQIENKTTTKEEEW